MDYYPYNRRIMKACGLTHIPDRRTFDRRLSTISVDVKEGISSMGNLFVKEKERLVDPYIVAIDSTLLRAKAIYSWRSISVEPLIEHIKSVSRLDPTIAKQVTNSLKR
jgi:hypothetical protein